MLFSPARYTSCSHREHFSQPISVQREALVQFGRQSSAYFIFQPDVRCFKGRDGGLLHYGRQRTPLGPVNLIFTNPLTSGAQMPHLIEEFECGQSCPNVYLAVDQCVADVLRGRAYHVNQIGAEHKLDLTSFTVQGKAKKQLRHASHFGQRQGGEVRELPWNQVNANEVVAVSRRWLENKSVKQRELRYVTRPPVFDEEWGVRKFYCYQGGRLLGFIFFDPYFEQGALRGYCANILRALPEKSANGVLDFIMLAAIEVFQAEGVQELSLGVAPLQNIEAEPGERASIRLISRLLFEYGNSVYAFKGLAYHKTRYRPQLTPWYLCSKDISLLRLYWSMLSGLRVVGAAGP